MNQTTDPAQRVTDPRARIFPDTLEDAGATAAAMLHSVSSAEMHRIYRENYREAATKFAAGFQAYVLRQHEGHGR